MKKRILIAVLFALFVASVFTSCKSKDCPTYDQNYVEINLFE